MLSLLCFFLVRFNKLCFLTCSYNDDKLSLAHGLHFTHHIARTSQVNPISFKHNNNTSADEFTNKQQKVHWIKIVDRNQKSHAATTPPKVKRFSRNVNDIIGFRIQTISRTENRTGILLFGRSSGREVED